MNYYIVDDNIATLKTLETIVTKRKLGTVVGSETDPVRALDEIVKLKPDIVLVDLLMGGIDGISLVTRIREMTSDIYFVMISKVTDKALIQNAYNAGIEFFINKPVNIVEVERVIGNVAERIRMKNMVATLKTLFDSTETGKEVRVPARTEPAAEDAQIEIELRKINVLLGTLGMLGERGVQDIREIYRCMYNKQSAYDKSLLQDVADAEGDTVKNVEQRVRRAIKKGLTNAAMAGLDDFGNEIFVIYANYVFDFACLREEMNFQKGKSETGGRISISKFMEGLVLYSHCTD